MKPAHATMQAFINTATAGLSIGTARKYIAPGLMPLVVEVIDPGERFVSLAHYGEQNGDAMRDPEIVFWRDDSGAWCPISFRNDYAHVDREYVVFEKGRPVRWNQAAQRDVASFTRTWAQNIAASNYTLNEVAELVEGEAP